MQVHQIATMIAAAGLALGPASAAPAADAVAAPAKTPANQCFLVRDVNGFNAPDDHTVYVRVGIKTIYRLDLMMSCLDMSWRQEIGLESRPASPWICNPLDAEVVYHETGIHNRCPIKGIHRLSPEEVAALPKKQLP